MNPLPPKRTTRRNHEAGRRHGPSRGWLARRGRFRSLLISRGQDEGGATLVIVALSLVAIFAMLTLTVDVGGLLYKRRELVNGSDAAALAAAQSCASVADTSDPEAMADRYATDNVNGLTGVNATTNIVASRGCDTASGYLTVRYGQQQHLYFGEVLGFSNSAPVSTEATAAWGPLGGGNIAPVMLEQPTLDSCGIPPATFDPANPITCAFWQDNGDLGNAQWGFLNLDADTWNVAPDYPNCHSEDSTTRQQWIDDPAGGPNATLNGNPPGSLPTYVCIIPGHTDSDWQTLRNHRGESRLFPINDCTLPPPLQVDRYGNGVVCGTAPDKYDIVGFTYLTILQVYKGNEAAAIGTTGASGTCTTKNNSPYRWTLPTQTLDLDTISSASNGWNSNNCPPSVPTDNISNVVLTNTNGPACCTLGVNYTYDSATHVITWLAPIPKSTKISFDWSFNNTAGACGYHPSNPNAVCLVLQYNGDRTGPGPIGGGQSFGAEGVRLCDRSIQGSCP